MDNLNQMWIFAMSSYGVILALIDYSTGKSVGKKEVDIYTLVFGTLSYLGYCYSIFMFFLMAKPDNIFICFLLTIAFCVLGPYGVYISRLRKK